MLIGLCSLATTSKFQRNICFRAVCVININKNVKVVAIYESGLYMLGWPGSDCDQVSRSFVILQVYFLIHHE